MALGFTDNAFSAGSFTAEWTSCRFTITPLEGPRANQPIKLSGVWELTGQGYTREGVNLVYTADGTGQASKITKGRENPNEMSMKLDPLVNENILKPAVSPPGRVYRFNFTMQVVDPAGAATFTRSWTGCVPTGEDTETPGDNAMSDTFKFKPTRRG